MEAASDPIAEPTPAALQALIGLVHRHTGIAMTERKSVLLQGRLRPRLKALALTSYEAYFRLVETRRDEVQAFINMVTTNDTAFFRTPHIWDYFSTRFLPQWMAAHPGGTLRVWSAAAASGEEAYSLAMRCEEFSRSQPQFRYQILATDISTAVLETGRAGVYVGRSVERMMTTWPALFERYFSGDARSASVLPLLKTHVRFVEHNLLTQLQPPEKFDLVFLRNVLIYFEPDIQKKVVDLLRPAMQDDARLILGESESLGWLQTCYRNDLPQIYHIVPEAA
jgi:chemotaxis protein methyltransferase CheR